MDLGLDENIFCFNIGRSRNWTRSRAPLGRAPCADRHPRQSRRRCAHPRQDRDRQVGEQVWRADLPRPRGLRLRCTLPGLNVHGVDMHIGSQITDLQPFDDAFALLAEFVQTLRPTATNWPCRSRRRARHSVSQRNNPPLRRSNTPKSSRRRTAALGCQVILEPGRLIVGNAGALVASVIYLKKGENKHFVIVDAAMTTLSGRRFTTRITKSYR